MNIAHLLRRSAQLYPDQPAMHHGEHVLWSYAALGARTASLAASRQRLSETARRVCRVLTVGCLQLRKVVQPARDGKPLEVG